MRITIFEWMEDFDNQELSSDWWEHYMKDAIIEFNDLNCTNHPLDKTLADYIAFKRDKSNNPA